MASFLALSVRLEKLDLSENQVAACLGCMWCLVRKTSLRSRLPDKKGMRSILYRASCA